MHFNDTEPGNKHGYDRNRYPEEQDMDTFTPPPLRQTVPTIFRANPPTEDEFIGLDPEASNRHRNYMSNTIPYDTLSDEEVKRHIQEYMDEWGGAGNAGFTSGQYHPIEMRERHIKESLERLKNKQAGLLSLPKEVEDIYGWSKTDKKAEPMDIALRLIKEKIIPNHKYSGLSPQSVNPLKHVEGFLSQLTPDDTGVERIGDHTVHFEGFTDMCNLSITPDCPAEQIHQEVWSDFDKRQGGEPIHRGKWGTEENPTIYSVYHTPQDDIQTGEPMSVGDVLVKERISPEAIAHKLEYDKKYESNPVRVKYREDLNRERRKRHIYGQGGPDMSHTSQHTIVPEDPHTNRARHFKSKGTLL